MSSIEVCFILVLLKILTLWLSILLTAGGRNFLDISSIVEPLDCWKENLNLTEL